MKNLKSMALMMVFAALTISTVFTSCNPDACKDVICDNDGLCDNGVCTCLDGYEGESCELMSKSKFLKNWAASDLETGTTNPIVYSCVIADGANLTSVVISNSFSDDYFVNNINATVSGNTITIPSQQPDNDGFAVAGSGEYNATTGRINWTYSLTKVSTAEILTYSGTWQ